MKLDLKRDALLIIPETEQDRAYVEDTLGMKTAGAQISLERVADVTLGYAKLDSYVLKALAPVVLPAAAPVPVPVHPNATATSPA